MYYNTLQEAIDAAPDCTHVLTTGPDWDGCTSIKRKYVSAIESNGSFFDTHAPTRPRIIGDEYWIIALDRRPTPEQQVTAALFDQAAPEHDPVNKPSHYQLLPGVQVYDVRHAILAKHPTLAPSVVDDWSRSWEYLTRMFGKNELEDAKKARWYLDKLIARLEGDNPKC